MAAGVTNTVKMVAGRTRPDTPFIHADADDFGPFSGHSSWPSGHTAMAFAFASKVAEKATYDAIHTHGGYGFMLEYDVQLHWRRVRGWARVWGDAEAGYRRAGAARYGRGAS